MPAKYTIEPISSSHFKTVVEISNHCFGKGYINEKVLIKSNGLSKHNFVFKLDNIVIGFCICNILSPKNILSKFTPFVQENEYPCGIINVIAIKPTFQRQGFGSKLLNYALRHLNESNCKSVIYPAWVENDRQYFLKKIEDKGFKPLSYFKYFWKNDSTTRNFVCKKCGSPPCTCSLRLYKMDI